MSSPLPLAPMKSIAIYSKPYHEKNAVKTWKRGFCNWQMTMIQAESWKSLAFHEVTILSERHVFHCKFNGEWFEYRINALEPLHGYYHDHTGSKEAYLTISFFNIYILENGGLGGYKTGHII
jgi:hypothetical protein